MNRDEAQQLLQLRFRVCGHNFNGDVLETWAEMLAEVPYGEAVVAMRRAAGKHRHVNWFEFQAELDAHRHAKANDHRPERLDCGDCDGTGWREVSTRRWDRCDHRRRSGPVLPYSEGIAVAVVACETEMRARGVPFSQIEERMTRLLELARALTEGDAA